MSASDDLQDPAPWPFIVGVPRSGTTLLRLMLDAHPEMAIPPESHFFQELFRRDVTAMSLEEFHELITGYFTWRDFALDESSFDRALQALAPFSVADGLRALYRLYAARFGKVRWGEKTPDYGMIMPEIAQLLPEAHFIHIIRDGRDVALSRRPLWFGPGTDIAAQAEDWLRWIQRARSFGRSSDKYLEIRYEALVTSPTETLQQVCEFLSLPYREEMLTYHEVANERLSELKGWEQEDVTADQLRSIQELTTRPLTTERVFRWEREMQLDEVRVFEDVAGPVLEELGYRVGAADTSAAGTEKPAATLIPGVRRATATPSVSGLLLTHDIPDQAMPWLLGLKAVVDEFVILVDSQVANEQTRARAKQLGTRIVDFAPDRVAEAFLSEGVSACSTDWILRLDSDEELSSEWEDGAWRELLAFRDYTHFRIPRRWITGAGNFIPVEPWFPDYQIRLFRNAPSKIRFGTTIHGVMEIPGRCGFTRNLAIHHHVLWMLSRKEREEKVAFYNSLPGGGLGHYYLYEDYHLPQAAISSAPFDAETELVRMGMLFDREVCAVSIQVSGVLTECIPGQLFWPVVQVINTSARILCSYPPFPVNISYHWIDTHSRATVTYDGERTPLLPMVAPQSSVTVAMLVIAPLVSGSYTLQITLVQEGIRWFEQHNHEITQECVVTVREPRSPAAARPAN
jgi:hypothetical protein